ncbi:N-acetylglucosamine-6-phosphate deacetylase [Lentilitoribacter sp. Alg239-R112]|uniref:N-acetylglucosamine-6-phosphate deacetylase n=1 Tax=Lentilitoribacter sp. Alg239-R112 TaxID=2305987 RepID=UPI001FCEB89C|nr:N-acetylglucosamine-6-phosphate deacetylase [Lentilitoribacter sp. Alg239-R112]
MNNKAIIGANIFDAEKTHKNSALLLSDGKIIAIVADHEVPSEYEVISVDGGTLTPGFIDLQVNGGGGVLLNDEPTIDGIRTICDAHAKFGTTSLLPTLITDDFDNTKRAIEAGIEAHKQNVPGFLGLHLEGPHLSTQKKGAHDPSLIRKMTDEDVKILIDGRKNLPNLMITVGIETVTLQQIKVLSEANIIVSLGHTNCTYEQAVEASESGATCATHLFNAMSPLTHREPGLVGAAINEGAFFCGLIADGHHVHPAPLSIALAAKRGPGKAFLVTDAMSTIGTDLTSFTLNDRTIYRNNGILTLENGTLAGADLDMISAVLNIQKLTDMDPEEAIRMATLYPAQCMGISGHIGTLNSGASADIIHIGTKNEIKNVWRRGQQLH